MPNLAGIDVGTSACKAVLMDERGKLLARASRSYGMSTPAPGWAEQDPEEWVRAAQGCLAELALTPDAIAFTGQMHGGVFLDDALNVIRPALLWCDQRTEQECADLSSIAGIEEISLNRVSPGFQAPSVLWLRNHEPASFARLRHVLFPKDFVQLRLGGPLTTEATDASGSGLFSTKARTWSEDLLQAVGLDQTLFPTCHEPGERLSDVGPVLVAGAGDQPAGAVGVGATRPGRVALSLGTSGVALAALDEPPQGAHPAVNCFCHADGGWLRLGVMLGCGGSLAWARRAFWPGADFREIAELAETASWTEHGPVFLPYVSGERCPVVAPGATASLLGLRASHEPSDLALSVFTGVTCGLMDCYDLVGGSAGELYLTGGGSSSPFWCQLIADASGATCLVPEVDEGPAMGAALLAGVGLGVWPDAHSAATATIRVAQEFRPSGRDFGPLRTRFAACRSVSLGPD